MGDQQSGPQEAVKGAVEGVKGKAKEVGGTILGRDDLTEEGQAQQDKADAQRDAGKKEAEAESARRPPRSARRRTNRLPAKGRGPVRSADRALSVRVGFNRSGPAIRGATALSACGVR
ncbi:hypothetical protein D522_18684 [Mycobacterium avium subsp. paratuberculosis S5]|nr:hypothetical protein D522_18684 [Mycobacterium avium subsp. paratuberculosis S5]